MYRPRRTPHAVATISTNVARVPLPFAVNHATQATAALPSPQKMSTMLESRTATLISQSVTTKNMAMNSALLVKTGSKGAISAVMQTPLGGFGPHFGTDKCATTNSFTSLVKLTILDLTGRKELRSWRW